MLSAELQELFVNNRRLEKPPVQIYRLEAVLGQNQYPNLIASLVDNRVGSQLYSLFLIIQYSKDIGISSNTTFLAKIYLDIILAKSNFIDNKTLLMTSLCCVWIATKLNEASKLSSGFSPEVICQHGHHQFSAAEVTDLELDLLELLDYRLNYTTPYDYIQPFFQTFPWLKKVKGVIGQLIDFSMTLPQLTHEKSEHIFYSCFLAICHIKAVTLNPLQKSIVSCQVGSIEWVEELKGYIVEAYNKIEASDKENLTEENIQIELE